MTTSGKGRKRKERKNFYLYPLFVWRRDGEEEGEGRGFAVFTSPSLAESSPAPKRKKGGHSSSAHVL